MNISGIYQILNLFNGKFYIGSAINFKQRWAVHQYQLNNKKHHSILLQRAWNKYGKNAFQFVIIESVSDLSKLIEVEQKWIDASKCCNPKFGYNISIIAESSRGRIRKPVSAATKLKISLANKGRKHTEEFKLKMSISMKGKKNFKGLTHSEETKAKIAASLTGYKHSEETKKKVSLAGKGRKPINRKINKWPHERGIRCNCEECRQKRIEYYRNYRKTEVDNCAPTI